jgi:hypothetical protein
MRRIRTEFRLNQQEKKLLDKICKKYDLSFGCYIRKKLFDENDDLINSDERYISPEISKHNLITITNLYKLYYLLFSSLTKQGMLDNEVIDLEKQSLEYARQQRAKYGYEIIKTDES